MPTFKSALGVIAALVPIVYCGGLIYYFLHVSGSFQAAQDDGLGATVVGLGVVDRKSVV